jgi:hypothetical protein
MGGDHFTFQRCNTYPEAMSILKELMQRADQAAGSVKFLVDEAELGVGFQRLLGTYGRGFILT